MRADALREALDRLLPPESAGALPGSDPG
jgi:hypothetical protein